LAGVAVGAALGVLFAPDKGWNTRKRISKKAEDITDDLREKFDEFLDSISVKLMRQRKILLTFLKRTGQNR